MTAIPERLLVGESFSPWTKKARWALEHCGVTYQYREYVPTLSEPGLRWRLGQWSGSVSVPILFAGDAVHRGSWEIACLADQAGEGRLRTKDNVVSTWDALSEAALAEGRTRVVRCILHNDEALSESLPSFVPSALRKPLRFVARDAVKRLDAKYAHLVQANSLRNAFLATREALSRSANDYLLGDFSYADVTMAAVLEVIAPLADAQPPLGPATQKCWFDAALAAEFADLLAWRARLAAESATSYSQFQSPARN